MTGFIRVDWVLYRGWLLGLVLLELTGFCIGLIAMTGFNLIDCVQLRKWTDWTKRWGRRSVVCGPCRDGRCWIFSCPALTVSISQCYTLGDGLHLFFPLCSQEAQLSQFFSLLQQLEEWQPNFLFWTHIIKRDSMIPCLWKVWPMQVLC